MAMGLTLEQVVARTTANTAKAIRRPELGTLTVGGTADIAVLELRKGPAAFLDSSNAKLSANGELRCVLTIAGGTVVWDSEGLSLTNWKDAGPYSNFK
jgi:dihydroorotase